MPGMTKMEKFTSLVFSINVLIGIVAFGYFISYLVGMYLAIFITSLIYVPLVVLGAKPAMKEYVKIPGYGYYPKDDD